MRTTPTWPAKVLSSGSATVFASPLVWKTGTPACSAMAITRWLVVWPYCWKVMTSPTVTVDGSTGWTSTSDPLLMFGSIEPPVTMRVCMPRTRIAANAAQRAKSPVMQAAERIVPRILFISVLLSLSVFRSALKGGDRDGPIPGGPPRSGGDLLGGTSQLRGGVRDREVLREALEGVTG